MPTSSVSRPGATIPVSDSSGEAFYIRDEERGHFWSPTPLPSPRGDALRQPARIRLQRLRAHGTRHPLRAVGLRGPGRIRQVRGAESAKRVRPIPQALGHGYVEWVLGDLRPKSAMHVITEVDPGSGALFARNPYHTEFGGRVAFFNVDDAARTLSGDRTEFIGRNGALRSPAAMTRSRLSGKVGAGLDPCAAIQVPFEIADGQEREFIFTLGAGRDAEDARNLAYRSGDLLLREARSKRSGSIGSTLSAHCRWKHRTRPSMCSPTGGSCTRLWRAVSGRGAGPTSRWAFGFRDQLQDVMALIHAEPHLVREHLLRCAGRQFLEGDVQHWWHPPSGRGVRTHCSDDYLWLPLAASRYVLKHGDTGVMEEPIHFIEGRPVDAEKDSYYDLPGRSEESASLYETLCASHHEGLQAG